MCVILEGEAVIEHEDGSNVTAVPGGGFVIPYGAHTIRHVGGYVKKSFIRHFMENDGRPRPSASTANQRERGMKSIPVAVVTGGSRGIGKAVAHELASLGYRVQLVARNRGNLEAARDELVGAHGLEGGMVPGLYAVDVSDVAAVRAAVGEIAESCGRIDLLFNGAGISIPGTFELDAATFTRLFEVNMRAPFVFMQEVVPLMERQGGGRIINMGSRNSKVAVANLGGYSASKFGVLGLGESAFRELSAKGIAITTLCPGWVNTDMAADEGASLAPEEMIQPEDIAVTVRWLLSLRGPVRVMDVPLECAKDVERRGSVEIAKLRALRERHREEYDGLTL